MEERSPGQNSISVHCQHRNNSSVDWMGRPTYQPLLFLSRVYFHLPLDTRKLKSQREGSGREQIARVSLVDLWSFLEVSFATGG